MRKAIFAPNAKTAQDVIRILNLVRLCERLGKLPKDGGLLDQDYLFMFLMEQIFYFDKLKEEFDERKNANIKSKT